MKRYAAMLMRAFLVLLVAINIIPPPHAAAQHGTVTINGQLTYQPRNWNPQLNNWAFGNEIRIDLYEKDLQGNEHYLATTYTTLGGYFSFPSMENWWSPDNRQLNIFYKVITTYGDTDVTDRLFRNYAFASTPTLLSHDGAWTINFQLTSQWSGYQAIWIFEDLRNAWNFVNNFGSQHPGAVTAVWESSLNCYPLQLPDWLNIPCVSFAYGGIGPNFIFISHDSNTLSMDTVLHETGHMYVINANNWWYTGCPTHFMFFASDLNCAWSEGWANFLALAVNGDRCYDINAINPCIGRADIDYYDLEAHSRADSPGQFPWGDQVEGRIAAALYDLYDYNSEGFDGIFAGFYPIAQIALGSTQVTTASSFWNRWKTGSGQDEFLSGLTLWWNTISYINIRQDFLPIVIK